MSSSALYGSSRMDALSSLRRKQDNIPKDPREELTRYEDQYIQAQDSKDILQWWKVSRRISL